MDPVLPTDTFETWRQRTNSVIDIINNVALKSEVLLINADNGNVDRVKTFTAGIQLGNSSGGPTIIPIDGSSKISISHDMVAPNKNISAGSITSTTGIITLNGTSYTFPNSPSEGYLKAENRGNGNYDIEFMSAGDIVGDVVSLLSGNLSLVEELVPVGAIVGFKSALPTTNDGSSLWLECDGAEITYQLYPELYVALGGMPPYTDDIFLPDLNDPTPPSGVLYYIKARSSQLVEFKMTKPSASGIKFTNSSNVVIPELDLAGGGGKISLDVSPTYFTYSGNTLSLLASSNATPNRVASYNNTGNLRSANVPSNNTDDTVVANIGYVKSMGHREHKFRQLNAKGFNSYGIQPTKGIALIDLEDQVIVYGANTSYRFGKYESNAFGHNLSISENTVEEIYVDDTNCYMISSDGRVFSTGSNVGATSTVYGKAGLAGSSADLNGRRTAFGSNTPNNKISKIILSYDTNASTAYALTTDGRLLTGGSNARGQLGDSTDGRIGEGNYTVTKAWLIGSGTNQTGYALRSDNTLWVCGFGANGQTGRLHTAATNSRWVPVLNPNEQSWTQMGVSNTNNIAREGTTTVYTVPVACLLKQYDRVKIGTALYTVDIIETTTSVKRFKLYGGQYPDSLTPNDAQGIAIANVRGATVYKRFDSVDDAYFGGQGSNTFGILKTHTNNRIFGWGYNGNYQLGLGNAPGNRLIPRSITIGSNLGIRSVHTGLDDTVHVVDVNGKLWAAGSNEYGLLGIGNSTLLPNVNVFTQLPSDGLEDSGLPNPSQYEVDKFFSSGNNTRFCLFKSRRDSLSAYTYKLTAWGLGSSNELSVIWPNNTMNYDKPQGISIKNDATVVDIQTTRISDTETLTVVLQEDPESGYGPAWTCGRIRYNFNAYPSGATIPYLTRVKNI